VIAVGDFVRFYLVSHEARAEEMRTKRLSPEHYTLVEVLPESGKTWTTGVKSQV